MTAFFKRRYSASRNIVAPETRIEEVSERVLERDIEAAKGYYIDQDSVKRYDHAILGVECVEYIEIKLDDGRHRKRGKKESSARYLDTTIRSSWRLTREEYDER